MKIAIIKIAIFLVLGIGGEKSLEVVNENKLNFSIGNSDIFEREIQMFCSFLDVDQSPLQCNHNYAVDFRQQILPLDIHCYYQDKGNENYYTLLTKTAYGIGRDISFFNSNKLSQEAYIQSVMPSNELSKVDNHYILKVGFGAPDINYTLNFYSNEELNQQYPELVEYFKSNDNIELTPAITVIQHNFKYGQIMGQKTSKMSLSFTRYFGNGKNKTLAINYTLSFIHNLPPTLFGGSSMLVNQMRKGIIAFVRDTRAVCEHKND